MTLPDSFKTSFGAPKVFRSSGGDALLTLTSVANNAARQSDKIDLGALRAEAYAVECHFEFAPTPTPGLTVELYWAPSSDADAGDDNPGGISGVDGAYTGYSSNLDASLKQLQRIGAFICTAQATATVQKQTLPAAFCPLNRYGTLVVYDKSGAAFHSSATNMAVKFHPIENTIEA